jgi:hypothetical protein
MNARTGDLRIISALDLAKAPFPEVSTEVIGAGQIAVIAAQFGRGKTPLLAHVALEAACGVRLTPFGLDDCHSPVIVLDGETSPASYRAMFKRLMHAASIEEWPEALRFWFKLFQGLTPGNPSFDNLTRLVASHGPGLVILDPLRQFAGGYDLTKTRDALSFMNSLRALQGEARGLRITLSHHLTKRDLGADHIALADDPWAWLEKVSGSLALLDHADVRLGFEEENGKLVLAGIKRGVGIVGPWHFEMEENSEGQPCRFRFEDREHSILARYAEFLKQLPDTFTWKTAKLLLKISDSTMQRFIKAVLKAGLVVQGPDVSYRKVEVRK